jgi:hypothetical protein
VTPLAWLAALTIAGAAAGLAAMPAREPYETGLLTLMGLLWFSAFLDMLLFV